MNKGVIFKLCGGYVRYVGAIPMCSPVSKILRLSVSDAGAGAWYRRNALRPQKLIMNNIDLKATKS